LTIKESQLKKQIDVFYYQLYDLRYTEAKIIEVVLSEEEFEKHKLA